MKALPIIIRQGFFKKKDKKMNYLARVKRSNDYDLIVNSLYEEIVDEETGKTTQQPISDVDGTTALLLTDGTSWELLDGDWQRTDEAIDKLIQYSLYPFIMQVCDSIHTHFIRCDKSQKFTEALLSNNNEDETVTISNLGEEQPFVQANDFAYIETELQMLLTQILENSDNGLIYDNKGLHTRITGKNECVMVHLVMFPPQFLNTVLDMLGYDLFKREGKEVRTERLGNYTYTNFEPAAYYGLGTYPQDLEDSVKYWQHVHI